MDSIFLRGWDKCAYSGVVEWRATPDVFMISSGHTRAGCCATTCNTQIFFGRVTSRWRRSSGAGGQIMSSFRRRWAGRPAARRAPHAARVRASIADA